MEMQKEEIDELRKKDEEAMNSIEYVWENIKILGEDNDRDKRLIAKTLHKLSKEIREEVLDNVVFVTFSSWGLMTTLVFYKHIHKEDIKKEGIRIEKPMIFLNFEKMEKEGCDSGVMMGTIAHEIAHYILKHNSIEEIMNPKSKELSYKEKAADDLIMEWGFKRQYKSYDLEESR